VRMHSSWLLEIIGVGVGAVDESGVPE